MIGFKVTKLFFDKPAVTRRVDAATRRVFSKFGSYVWRSARSSIRKRKRASAPGQPPSSHSGLLRKFIYFSYDPRKRSVVIGPERLNGRGGGIAPSILEYGGTETIKRHGKRIRAKYAPRPYMGPAFDENKPKLPAMWRGSVSKGRS